MLQESDTIMLIDDNEVDNFITQKLLLKHQTMLHIINYTDAAQAIDYIKLMLNNNEFNKLPKIVFLDINMPGIDGFDFLTMYHQLITNKPVNTKIIILTSSISKEDKKKAMEFVSVWGVLEKPFNIHDVLNLMNNNRKVEI